MTSRNHSKDTHTDKLKTNRNNIFHDVSGEEPQTSDDDKELPSMVTTEIIEQLKSLGIDISDPTAQLVIKQVRALSLYQGSLPPPELLEHYNRTIPGLGNRLIDNWDSQICHRQSLEAQMTEKAQARMDRSQRNALIVAVSGMILSAFVGIWGHWFAAAVLAVVSVGGPSAAMLLARHLENKDRHLEGGSQ